MEPAGFPFGCAQGGQPAGRRRQELPFPPRRQSVVGRHACIRSSASVSQSGRRSSWRRPPAFRLRRHGQYDARGAREQAERTWTRSYALDAGGAAVGIINVNGTIKVEAVEGSTLDVTAVITARGATTEDAKKALDKVEMAEEATPASVRVQAKYPRELGRQGIEVAYTIRAPRTARLALETVNGRVQVNGAFAGVKARRQRRRVRRGPRQQCRGQRHQRGNQAEDGVAWR